MKTLIAYYSRAGATKKAAEGLQKITNGDGMIALLLVPVMMAVVTAGAVLSHN